MSLSFETLAVTVAEADAYATARVASDWTGDTTAKTAALRRGQDYIAGKYNGRWSYTYTADGVTYSQVWSNSSAPTAVKYAIIEAAIREIKVPFCLTPDVVPGAQKVLTEVKGIKWTQAGSNPSLLPVVTAINYLLADVTIGQATTIQRA